MLDSDLAALVTAGSEDLDVEYKAWMDTSRNDVRAKLADLLRLSPTMAAARWYST